MDLLNLVSRHGPPHGEFNKGLTLIFIHVTILEHPVQ